MISVQVDVKAATRYLNSLQKEQVPFAVSQTLNQLAFNISRKSMPAEAQRTFKGGATAFTKRGFKFTKSNKRMLMSSVFIDEKQAQYMKFQISGGTRFPSRRVVQVPTASSRLNKFGNMTRATMSRIYSDKTKFFVGKPKGSSSGEGVWERYGKGQRIRMVAAFRSAAQYQPLFPFAETAEGVVFGRSDGFSELFRRNLTNALATAR